MENHVLFHAIVLNFHQPAGNLDYLLDHNPWEAKQILWAIDRVPRSLWQHEGLGKVHLNISGTLLETLTDPDFQKRVYGTVDTGSLLWYLQNKRIIEMLGSAYYHPVLPLIPEDDRREHISRWRGLAAHLFWRNDFQGFWPPEMGFSMGMIPLLREMGYIYVIVDSPYVKPLTLMSWQELHYRPHIARYGGKEIIVIVRDRELSDAQESGMEFSWFEEEVRQRTSGCDFPPLVTTCTDGDNGGWFRNTCPDSNFWGVFYNEFMKKVSSRQTALCPLFINEYIDRYGIHGEVTVETGAWNTGWHDGRNFMQWQGSKAQQETLQRVHETSRAVHDINKHAIDSGMANDSILLSMEDALWHLLRAETSCNFYWGEAWLSRCHQDLDKAWGFYNELRRHLDRMESERGML